MFNRFGEFVARHWLAVIGGWVVLAVALHWLAPRWQDVAQDGDLAYLPDRMPSVQGEILLAEAFPKHKAKSEIALLVERPTGPLTAGDFQIASRLSDKFEALRDELPIVDIWSRNTEVVGEKLTSRVGPEGQATLVVMQLTNEFMATDNMRVLDRVLEVLDEVRREPSFPAGLQLGVTGSAALGGDMLRSAAESIRNTEWTTIGLVILILLLVYRAPVLAIIPLVTIGLSFLVSTDILALLARLRTMDEFSSWWHFKVFTTTKIFIVVILFGAGTDFCLFLISRFREELEDGLAAPRALADSIGSVGHALVGSAMTTVFGLGMMFFADFGKFRNSGPAIALSLLVTLLACLTMAPAMLRACGEKVFWPGGLRVRTRGAGESEIHSSPGLPISHGFWDWASRVIVARPGLILVASVVVMAPLAYAGLDVGVSYDLLNELQADRPSVIGTRMATRHFAAGQLTPVTVLAVKEDGHFNESEGSKEIARLTKQLYEVDGVIGVRSLAEPLGDKPGLFNLFSAEGRRKLAAQRHKFTKATYLTQVPGLVGKVARFDVVLKYQPFSLDAVAALDRLQRKLSRLSEDRKSDWWHTRFDFAGATAGVRDLKQVTESDQLLIERLTVLAVLAVLIVILRRPIICIYLIVSVLFSYYVTIGCTELLFNQIYGDTFEGLDWKVPIFLFVILIAVGEDYNIYLVTRVNEEQRRFGPLAGLRVAIARTGGIITSCGVIMAGTFVSMTTGSLRAMHELGFALSAGVMLDTCIVRPILVPALIALVDRRRERRAGAGAEPESLEKSHWMAVQP
jgi:RND superfamily putative drug exporter